jgi:hypothetical protein
MKDFVRASGRLRALPFPARLTYSVFLSFTLLGLAFSAWLGADMLGTNLSGIDAYYAGAPAAIDSPPPQPSAAPGGPTIELPNEPLTAVERDPIPLRKLLEVTHFHLFSMPVYLMVLAHLFMLSRLGNRTKSAWIALGTLSVAMHIAAPWVARSGTPGSSLFYGVSGLLLMAAFLVMAGVPLYEMWRSPAPSAPSVRD